MSRSERHYETIAVERQGGLALITIQRESALNALNQTVIDELLAAVASVEEDTTVRVVAVTGAGRAFVAGADIAAMQDLDSAQALEFSQRGLRLGAAIENSRVPYIAAVNGFALGGGCELAMACDFIYASAKAKFGQPEVTLGVIPGFGGTQRLLRRVGIAAARRLIYTGEIIGADEALRLGLADVVCAPDELMSSVTKTADAIANNGPLAVAAAKRVMQQGQSMPLGDALNAEANAFAALFATADQSEGMTAFLSKRRASFTGA